MNGRSPRCYPGLAVLMKHGWTLVRLRGAVTGTCARLSPLPTAYIAVYVLTALEIGAATGSCTRTICLEGRHAGC